MQMEASKSGRSKRVKKYTRVRQMYLFHCLIRNVKCHWLTETYQRVFVIYNDLALDLTGI